MKLFGFNITRAEKRNSSYSTLSEALQFGNYSNNHSAMTLSAVYRAVEIISDSMALLPIEIAIKSDKKDNKMTNHPLHLAFKDGLLTKYNLMKLLIQSVMLKGNGYAYIKRAEDGTPLDFIYLDSQQVQVFYNKEKRTLWYQSTILGAGKIEPYNMIHLVKNSYDGINGISVLSFASRSIDIASNKENSAKNFFGNGTNLSGILTVDGQLSGKQREDIRSSWNSAYTEGGQGLAILQGNMHYQPISLNATDAQLIQSRKFSVEDIARFFGLSPLLLGETKNLGNIEEVQNLFLLHTLQPYITMVEEEFNRKLLKPSEGNLQINLDETYLLRTNKEAQANFYGKLLDKGVLSINEVRSELGYNVIDGGDRHFIPYTDINQNTLNGNKTVSE